MGLKILHHRSCQAAATEAGRALAELVKKAKYPLLLLSGGSSLNAARVMATRLSPKDKKKLIIGQIDAKVLPFMHKDSNWQQIEETLGNLLELDPKLAMVANGDSPDDIASSYSAILSELIKKSDMAIGLYGITTHGGIGGIMPTRHGEDFMRFLDGRHVVKYRTKAHIRITTTTEVVDGLDRVIVLVCGKNKHETVMNLDKDLPAHKHPAQLLKDAKNAVVYVNVGR